MSLFHLRKLFNEIFFIRKGAIAAGNIRLNYQRLFNTHSCIFPQQVNFMSLYLIPKIIIIYKPKFDPNIRFYRFFNNLSGTVQKKPFQN